MRKPSIWAVLLAAVLTVAGCAKTVSDTEQKMFQEGAEGAIRLSLAQDETISVKAPDAEQLPSIDDFWVEIFNSRGIRLYCKTYDEAKDETIKLNAGNFTLQAHHGDTLGAGFGKAYYLAKKEFTVHGFVENGNQPDQVSAVAKLANVKLFVEFGDNLSSGYSDYYAVVRHSRYTSKQVKFLKSETRAGYIPAGNLYLEVYAYQGGNGAQGGEAKWVYYKSAEAEYQPNDFVTFRVEAGVREGTLGVNILVDRDVETIEQVIEIDESKLPTDPPVFNINGQTDIDEYEYELPIGPGHNPSYLGLTFNAAAGYKSVVLETTSAALGAPASVELVGASDSDVAALAAKGITFVAIDGEKYGLVDVTGTANFLSLNAAYNPSNPVVASFKVTVTDNKDKVESATINIKGIPAQTTISILDYNIWGWKFVAPKATVNDVTSLDPSANLKLQVSKDGSNWTTFNSTSKSGATVNFADATGLTAGTAYQVRTIFNDDPNNVSTAQTFTTETAQQVGNNGFEQYTENTAVTAVAIISDFNVKWWQLYSGSDQWWANNGLAGIYEGQVAAAYQDYKTYPTVALTNSNPYAGSYSVMLTTIVTGTAASEVAYGSNVHYGEIYLGTANNGQGANWAKSSEGHAFSSRPSKLNFFHKFTVSSSKPYVVSVEILDAQNNVIGSGSKNNQTSSVSNWTEVSIPINYTVTDKKAAKIKIDFKSSSDGSEEKTKKSVNTLSGSHNIHAGNILYLDNITLKYE
ncbi:MAG: DUF4493 domain-containing protein [Bacteroidales bacterium]|nr:DUF4493 domain-containing protein [Bacteroidales bacterium]